jgi:hypothetical protein
MRYTVVWASVAKRQLADIWADAPSRREVTAAADAIDSTLGQWPLEYGESRGGNTRIAIEGPLVAYYDVQEEDRLVRVLYLRFLRGRS